MYSKHIPEREKKGEVQMPRHPWFIVILRSGNRAGPRGRNQLLHMAGQVPKE
jgi:hypothetical protein